MILSVGMLHLDAQDFRTFDRKALEYDLDYLLRNLELYGNDEDNWLINDHFRHHSDSVRKKLYDGMDELSFFRHISRLLEHTQQRHVRLGFSKRDPMSGNAVGWNEKNASMFPFQLKFINGRAYVWENYSDERNIERGTEILSINGRSIDSIVDELLPFIISDGQIQVSKYYDLSKKFMLYYFWYIEEAEEFFLEFVPIHNEHIRVSRVSSIVYKDILRRKASRYPTWKYSKDTNIAYAFHIDEKTQGAILRLKTFKISRFQKENIDFKKLFREIFAELKEQNIHQLILDVRDNGGGNMECLYELLGYLLPPNTEGAIKTSVSINGEPNAYKYPSTKEERFDGKLYVLINSGTFSAASELASFSKVYAHATLVGEESAGLYDGYAAGFVHRFKLPHSGIRIWLPRINYEFVVPNQKEKGRGVLPDYEITPDINDLVKGKDTQLLFTISLMKINSQKGTASEYGIGNN